VGFIVSGSLGVEFMDGSRAIFAAGDVFDIPPGHDGFTVGEEPCVQVEWMGIRAWAGFPTGIHSRVLATLLFTDVVDSTARAAELGDSRWRVLLSELFQASRQELERFGGREVDTTGDGMLATFEGPARALHCAAALLRCAEKHGVEIRVGVHVGEVELVGSDVRGLAVHEAARVMAAAAPGEILVSDMTQALAGASGLEFQERGTHELKGLAGEWRLAAYLPEG
jgi:class 3 adenylate cyclase